MYFCGFHNSKRERFPSLAQCCMKKQLVSTNKSIPARVKNDSITLGLLKHFKECHGIKKLCVLGKKSVNDNIVEFKREVTIDHQENYKLEQLHNVHESG